MNLASEVPRFGNWDQMQLGKEILTLEASALLQLAREFDYQAFAKAVEMVAKCQGNLIVIGMGKAGLIGKKISATLASTGTPSHFLHPGEAYHGDLGRIHKNDIAMVLSFSGETEEVTRLLPSLVQAQVPLIAITKEKTNTLGEAATVTLPLGDLKEACSLGLAPSTSTTAMLAIGDAVALVASKQKDFAAEDFARFHPGGSLGKKLATVNELMRPLGECRLASDKMSVREILASLSSPGRRTGAIILTNSQGELSGVFTDSDLARILERKEDHLLSLPIHEIMTANPATIDSGEKVAVAVLLLQEKKISELPVVDVKNRPVGLIDITDLLTLMPTAENLSPSPELTNGSGPFQILPSSQE
ncbi:MAG: KpsF/GutQ family sugar-phosphate isomerase [Pirellulaceae bacterium]|nr:KpsF/GutQ family sugar-phosphate isomerase [Pirellulaceae bacterium]